MKIFPKGSQTVLSRMVAAEVRARLAAERMGQREFAAALGASSHNYWSKRLRDEAPFTLDDLERIIRYWGDDPGEFLARAFENHGEWLYSMLDSEGVEELTTNQAHSPVGVDQQIGAELAVKDEQRRRPEQVVTRMNQRQKPDPSSFDEADEAARSEDTEKSRLD